MATAKNSKTSKPPKSNPESIITRLIEKTNTRGRKDITSWRQALSQAEKVDNPKRAKLYDLYDDIMLDNHLFAVTGSRKTRLLSTTFKVVNKKDKSVDQEKTDLLMKPWFYELLEHLLDTIYYGHSLVQIDKFVDGEITEISLVPRRHVIPEKGEYVINQSDDKGVPYRGTELEYWTIEIGKPKNLGLLAKAAPCFLYKKNALACWSEYVEIFGMPIRIGKTNTRSQTDLDRMADTLARMGSAPYGVFQDGETIEFKESTKGDAYRVYDRLIERTNSELSKLVLGQTMTTDDGSSNKQAVVHERVAELIAASDRRFIAFFVNFTLFEKLKNLGYPLEGFEFDFEVNEQISKEQWEIDQGLLQHFDIDPDYFAQKYKVPIKGIKKEADAKTLTTEFDNIVKLHADIHNLYSHSHG